jgi:hypothetical protein
MSGAGKGKALRIAGLLSFVVAGILLFVGGIVFGIWFATNFQIVPRGDLGKMMKETLDKNPELSKLMAKEGGDVSQALDKVLGSQPSAVKELAQQMLKQQTKASGPFTFKFKPGERLEYALSATMAGEGMEALGTSPANLDLGGKFDLVTESVDEAGNGILRMQFKGTKLVGDVMGSPISLTQDVPVPPTPDAGAGATPQQQDQLLALPLLGFLNTPVRMSVAPNGAARELPDASRPSPMIEELPMLTNIEFPSPDMQPGTQWESNFNMTVPGSSTPVRVRLVNTFTGYKAIGQRMCAVIDQKVSSERTPAAAAQLGSATDALGMVMGIKPPQIDLSGGNTIYFDTDNGQLVHSEMDLGMHVDISNSLGAAGKILGNLGQGLQGILGDSPESGKGSPPAQGQKPEDLLNLNMKINAAVSLVDPAGAQ